MKNLKFILIIVLAATIVAVSLASRADDAKAVKLKPYPLDTCLVCGMKLGDMGKPYAFVYKGQEIKVCDESEKKAFDKNPEKYRKKLADAIAKLKK